MPTTNETTLVSLFHTREHATKAMNDLRAAGVPPESIQTLGGEDNRSSAPEQALSGLKALDLPAKDMQVISDGLKSGGILIVVRAGQALAGKVERIFEHQDAQQIDERAAASQPRAAATAASGDTTISVVEEELVVGKHSVDRGGVRVFTHMVEKPVEEQVTLREEHATLERHAVNRPISEAEMNALEKDQSIEVREMGEEAVVGKTARIVEEVRIGKDSTERTEHIKDTVRKTQVDVDQVAGDDVKRDTRKA